MNVEEAVAELKGRGYQVRFLADDSFGCDDGDEHGAATYNVTEPNSEAWIADLHLCDACVILEVEGS